MPLFIPVCNAGRRFPKPSEMECSTTEWVNAGALTNLEPMGTLLRLAPRVTFVSYDELSGELKDEQILFTTMYEPILPGQMTAELYDALAVHHEYRLETTGAGEPWEFTEMLPPLTGNDAVTIMTAIATVWAIAWGVKAVVKMIAPRYL